jgi:AraC-like DNA-binding protein
MKVLPFKIPKPENEFIRHQVDDVPHFYDKLHQHPEVQLTRIFDGVGKLVVGDYIGRFQPRDIFLLGPDIPHVFRCDDDFYVPGGDRRAHMETLFFDVQVVAKHLVHIEEFFGLLDFFKTLNGCYRVDDGDHFIRKRILRLRDMDGLGRLIVGLEVLQRLRYGHVLHRLNKMGNVKNYSKKEGKRMEKVMRFLMEESHRPVKLSEVAGVASMNKEAFCRFFKERTRKTLTEFLNEVRITNACHLLGNKDLSISQVAQESGFTNLSYFNRVFKRLNGKTPKEFRVSLQKGAR